MTLDTISRRVNYQGDDRTTCFPFHFKVWGIDQVVVYCSDPATPWTETNITSRATVTLNEDNYGGAVVFANPPASGTNLAIVREGSFLQEDEYLSGSRFDAHEIEDRFDEDAAERQELLDATARSIKVPNSSTQTPEEVYEELLSGAAFVNNAIGSLTELYEQALYYYNLVMGYLGELSYTRAQEISFTVDKTHIVEEEDGWVCDIPNGFKYYPTTHQLLVTVDGLALTPDTHFEEIGGYGEESSQIRFKINMYQGQQVYIKAMFLGTEEFDFKLGEMDTKIEDANNELQNAIDSANRDFEGKTNELTGLIDETTDNFKKIIDGLDEEIAQTESLIKDALEIVGTSENWNSFQNAITELNSIYSTFTSNELPTQGYCELTSDYYGNSCLTLPGDVCYFKDTNTLHLAIDGLVLSPKYFEEVGGCICTPPLVEGGLQETVYYGANFVKIPEGVCLYKGQELHAWTESFWVREGWEPEEYQPDITTRLYATSTSGCIYHSDDLGRTWSPQSPEGSSSNAAPQSPEGSQVPEYLKGQRIVATSDTLWAFAGEKDDSQGESSETEVAEEGEGSTPSAGTLMCSTDGGLTWDCYIKKNDDSNCNGWQSFFGDPYAFAATDNALVLATCCGIFCCGSGGAWTSISFLGQNVNYCWGIIEPASDGSGFLAVDTSAQTPQVSQGEASQEENDDASGAPKRRQIVYFGSASSGGVTCSCTNNISDVTAVAGNGQYWVITDACGQVEYAANCPSSGYWQTSASSLGSNVNCIYAAREGFVALGSGTACAASPRNAWKYSAELNALCTGLHLPDHGLYLAVGCGNSGNNTLWSWDGLSWNCGGCVPSNASLNNIWASEHLPFFINEPVTGLEAMWPEEEPDEEPEEPDESEGDESQEGESGGSGDTEGGEDEDSSSDGEEGEDDERGGSQEEDSSGSNESGSGAAAVLSESDESPTAPEQHCYLWGPISPTYRLKEDLCFNNSSIPVRVTIDQEMPSETGSGCGNGATIAIYKSDTYQRLTRDYVLSEAKEDSRQAWCEFARYEACGPIAANTELYTCFAAPQSDAGFSSSSAGYPTCWPAGYYAAVIYCVYGGCSLQKSIPNINFYVSRKERYSSPQSPEGLESEGRENND